MTDVGREHPSYTYPIFRRYTGRMQFMVDGPEAVDVGSRGRVKRGEVISIGNPEYANSLADTGQFAHVAADTPLGVPAAPVDHGDTEEALD